MVPLRDHYYCLKCDEHDHTDYKMFQNYAGLGNIIKRQPETQTAADIPLAICEPTDESIETSNTFENIDL